LQTTNCELKITGCGLWIEEGRWREKNGSDLLGVAGIAIAAALGPSQ
jgi:hypothetical protein